MPIIFNMHINHLVVCLIINLSISALGLPNTSIWQGNWFPTDPGYPDLNKNVDDNELRILNKHEKNPEDMRDMKHGIKMGVSTSYCDDGKTNLSMDWNGSPEDYTCFDSRAQYKTNINLNPLNSCDHIPKNYWALHECMNSSIEYDDTIPTYGTHRPLWAQYGEYRYLPKQRWLHNLEHGGVAMLYHPCADSYQVYKLKQLVKGCLYRHVITPYNQLQPDRPLALVTWGCRLTMSVVDSDVVKNFIKLHALKGPEEISRDGQYNQELIELAKYVTNKEDQELCPN